MFRVLLDAFGGGGPTPAAVVVAVAVSVTPLDVAFVTRIILAAVFFYTTLSPLFQS